MYMPMDRALTPTNRFPERLPLALINQAQPTGGLRNERVNNSHRF